jgi:hypothetical protein
MSSSWLLYEGYGMVLAGPWRADCRRVHQRRGGRDGAGRRRHQVRRRRAFTLAVQRGLQDAGLRRRIADASWAAGQKLPRWEDTARIIAGVIKEVAP